MPLWEILDPPLRSNLLRLLSDDFGLGKNFRVRKRNIPLQNGFARESQDILPRFDKYFQIYVVILRMRGKRANFMFQNKPYKLFRNILPKKFYPKLDKFFGINVVILRLCGTRKGN